VTRKATWLILIVAIAFLALVSATALIVNLYRDSIALGVARSALGGSGITVTEVSVDSISASTIRFDAIVLELAGGGTVFIDGVTLPVRFRGLDNSTLHVDSVRFVPGAVDSGPPDLASSLQNYLDAPGMMPGATIEIDGVQLPGVPLIRDFTWHADPLNPTLRATVGDFEVFVTTTQQQDGGYRGSVRALLPDNTETLMVALLLSPDASGFAVEGTLSVLLEPFLPALHALGAVPTEVSALTASVQGTFDFRLDADAALPVSMRAVFDNVSGTTLGYQAGDARLDVSVTESAPLSATLEYPSLEWTASVPRASLSIRTADVELPAVHLGDSECRSGIRCRSALELTYTGLAAGALTVDAVTVDAAAATFVSGGDSWEVAAPNTRLTLQRPALGGHRVLAPAIHADVTGSSDRVSAAVRFATPEGGLSGSASLTHSLASARGQLNLDSAAIEFDRLSLPDVFPGWRYDGDIAAGRGTAQADIRWQAADSGFAYAGTAFVTADGLAGHYADIGFVGLGSRLEIGLDSQAPLAVKPARFDLALVDIGFPVENVSGTVAPDIDESAIAVSGLTMEMLGGTVTADPFRYDLDADSNALLLRASGIQLPLMAGLADLESISISGSVSGEIPVTIRGNNVIIDDGHLENDPPGGVIRYGGGAASGIVDDGSQLGIVTRTLRNFEFESLTSAVDYSQDGDLVLKMRLKGINPDVDPTQPVILNLNVENNVPQMLRSLQATRSIEDVLERRLAK